MLESFPSPDVAMRPQNPPATMSKTSRWCPHLTLTAHACALSSVEGHVRQWRSNRCTTCSSMAIKCLCSSIQSCAIALVPLNLRHHNAPICTALFSLTPRCRRCCTALFGLTRGYKWCREQRWRWSEQLHSQTIWFGRCRFSAVRIILCHGEVRGSEKNLYDGSFSRSRRVCRLVVVLACSHWSVVNAETTDGDCPHRSSTFGLGKLLYVQCTNLAPPTLRNIAGCQYDDRTDLRAGAYLSRQSIWLLLLVSWKRRNDKRRLRASCIHLLFGWFAACAV